MENLNNNLGDTNPVEFGGMAFEEPAVKTQEFKPAVPAKVTAWTKFRNFLFSDITVTMTPKQEKVLQEVHDFWHQEITGKKVHDFLFQEIKIIDNITL